MTRIDGSDYRAATARLGAWRRPLLITHSKPDGDALGAVAATALLLKAVGADPLATIFDPVPDRYRFMEPFYPLPVFGAQVDENALCGVDGVLVLDTCTYNQIEPLAVWLKQATLPKVVVDHHVTRDPLADEYLIDETAAATCVLLYELAKAAGWNVSPTIAAALFVGVATDTGWFRHSNTDARVLAAASDLSARGAEAHEIYRNLYQRETAGRFRLRGFALRHTELLCDGRLAVSTIPRTAFAECGAALGDTEDLVNESLQIESAVVSVMFVEQDSGVVRVGFRSKAPLVSTDPDVDVAAFAKNLGGGGHVRASGARIRGTLEDAKRAVLPSLMPHVGSRA